MADKKQNPVVIVVLIIIIVGAVVINLKRITGGRRAPGRVAPPASEYAPSPQDLATEAVPAQRRASQPQVSESRVPPESPVAERKTEKVTSPAVKAKFRQLTFGSSYDTQPIFSPNGREIAFVSFNKEGQNIYILDLNSSEEPVKLTRGNFLDCHPSWTPDGGKIIFSSNRQEKINSLFWVDKLTGDITPLNKEGTSPALSADGEWLSFVDQQNIWIMRLATKEFTPLTKSGYNDWPCWDKDGKKIYFSGNGSIKAFDLTTSELISVTFSTFSDYPAVSPVDNKLAYVSLESGRYDLWLMNPDGSGKAQLTGDSAREYFPSWSVDGKSIIFASDAAGLSQLWLLMLP